MAAFYSESGQGHAMPVVNVFDFGSGLVRRQTHWYQAIGIGEVLANYLLQEVSESGMGDKLGQAVAVYVVDKVIQHVRDCGEPIRMAVIRPRMVVQYGVGPSLSNSEGEASRFTYLETVHVLPQSEIEGIKETVRLIDADTKSRILKDFRSELAQYAATLPDIFKPKP